MNNDIFEMRRQRKRAENPCPRCGQHTGGGYVLCVDCRAERMGPIEVAPRFPRRLPAAPLYRVVKRHVELNAETHPYTGEPVAGPVLEDLGTCSRRYYEWARGRSLTVSIEIADRVLTRLGLDWFDVWPRDEFPEFAACLDAIDAMDESEAA